jgi:alkylated DNA repair dioxygenase AlkB
MSPRQQRGEPPQGFRYRPDFLSEAEEHDAVALIEAIDFRDVTMRGQTARRTVRHYGFDYGYESWQLMPADPFPAGLEWIRIRAGEFAELQPGDLAQILVTRYPAGSTIGWHRDAPMFGPLVVGVSFLSACRMRFQRTVKEERQLSEVELAPRSAYILGGEARSSWQHSIPPAKALRYSITFRTLRNPSRWIQNA